jgi:transcriptional regulator GlxA family with amidase domain
VSTRLLRIAVIAFDGISPFHLSVPCMVFGEEKDTRGQPRYALQVCAESAGPLRTNAGFVIDVQSDLSVLRSADLVIVPSWSDTLTLASTELLAALRKAHARGAKVVGLCLGAFVLAQAGLLDGRAATTHWMAATEFRLRYPAVHMRPEVLYVDEGDVVTSAGTAAGLDCCIHLLRQHFGADAANRAARRMVVAAHRHGGQAQYIEQPVPEPDDGRFGALFDWIQSNLQNPHSLDSLAERVCMSRRNFTRRFKQLTGTSVQQWLTSQRLVLAQRLLEDGDESVESIALMAGFGSSVSMRQHFAATLNTSPTNYRRQFRKS